MRDSGAPVAAAGGGAASAPGSLVDAGEEQGAPFRVEPGYTQTSACAVRPGSRGGERLPGALVALTLLAILGARRHRPRG